MATARAGRSARVGGDRLRGARPGAPPRAEVDARQRRADHRRRRLGERQDPRGRAARRPRLHGQRPRVLGQGGAEVPGRRARAVVEQPLRRRQEADHPLRAGRRRRRDRAVELPDRQLLRRLHPRARRRQQRDPQAERGHAAQLAADGGDDARVRPARGRLPGRHRRRLDRRGADRRRRLHDVHRLEPDRQGGDEGRGRRADPVLPRARRQGPDDRVRRRRHRARGQRRRVLLDEQRRPGVHLGRARLRRGAGLRRVRRAGHRQRPRSCARARPPGSARSTSAR